MTTSTSLLHKRFGWRALAVLALLAAGSASAAPRSAKLAPEISGLRSETSVHVIVQYRERATADRHARTLRQGGRLRQELPLVRGGAYTVTAAQLEELAADPDVEQVSLDHEIHATLDYGEQATAASIALSNGFGGQGVAIAVLDSGIADHPDLHNPSTGTSRVVYSESLLGDKVKDDLYGHGTHVAGILAGNGPVPPGRPTRPPSWASLLRPISSASACWTATGSAATRP